MRARHQRGPTRVWVGGLSSLLWLGCNQGGPPAASTSAETDDDPVPALSASLESAPMRAKRPIEQPSAPASPASSSVPSASPASSSAAPRAEDAPADGNSLAATVIAATVYAEPSTHTRRLGYIRLGGRVKRDAEPIAGKDCNGDFFRVYPAGYVCTEQATTNMNDPLVRATTRRPDLTRPLPYQYGFVRATAPQYLKVPTKAEQLESEFKLEEHLDWYDQNRHEVQRPFLGANDVLLDGRGIPKIGLSRGAGQKLSTQLSLTQLLGGNGDATVPWWVDGGRKIPNVSGFRVPDYAIFADRVRRKTGLSFVGAFMASDDGMERPFAVTVDMRLIPATKVKPDAGSMFHGVEVAPEMPLPFAFVIKRNSTTWKLIKGTDEARPDAHVPRRAIVPITGKARIKGGQRFVQTARDPKRWLQASDVGVVAPPPTWPEAAVAGEKWIDVSLLQQTLVLYEGKRPWYATLVSTGQDRLGDPKTTKATPIGEFRLKSKHIAAAMDSEENSTVLGGTKTGKKRRISASALATIERLKAAEKAGKKLDEDDRRRLLNIKKGRHPEYGVTIRRGSINYELRDVPWIQYFASGYALHGAYWHDVFGIPRSHGCINMSPIDAHVAFMWSDPAVPTGWHGINVSEEHGTGTLVVVRE